jgi:hypothetical protein
MKVKLMILLSFFLFAQKDVGYNYLLPAGIQGQDGVKPKKELFASPFSIFKICSPVFKYLS